MEISNLKISDSQKEDLRQFKEKLSDVLTPHHTDEILLRFLRVRNFNLKKAESNFRQGDCNRKIFGVNTLLETYEKPEIAQKYEGSGFFGYAKDGTPIRYCTASGSDMQGFIMSMSGYELCLYFSYIMEEDIARQREQSKKLGKEISQTTFVFDFDGFRIQQVAYKCVVEMCYDFARLLQDFYPEIWANVFVVNPPFFFDKIFNLFKPILNSHLLEKIHVVSKSSTGEVLLKYIDEDVLPAFLGGNRVDSLGNPRCTEFINFGGIVPEKYFGCNRISLIMSTDPGVRTVTIRPRSVFNQVVVAREEGMAIKVLFRTENGSIHFSVLYRELGSDPDNLDIPGENEILNENDERSRVKIVSANLRAQSHLVQTDGYGELLWPGIYIVRFDNTGSWFTSRKLFVKVSFKGEIINSEVQ